LLPQLLAEAKRMQNEIEMYKMGEEAANKLILQGRAAEADRDAWKAKAIEERANLTAEQRDALGAGSDALENLLDDWEIAEDEQANATLLRHILVIRDLLTASKPAWEITEGRKKAMLVAVGDMDLSENIHYLGVIRGMLMEAEDE
jgi:hypothetical protein